MVFSLLINDDMTLNYKRKRQPFNPEGCLHANKNWFFSSTKQHIYRQYYITEHIETERCLSQFFFVCKMTMAKIPLMSLTISANVPPYSFIWYSFYIWFFLVYTRLSIFSSYNILLIVNRISTNTNGIWMLWGIEKFP